MKEKLQGTGIQWRFGDSGICLNFRKPTGPVRNGREPIFVTILLPEFISDQAVRLAFSNFGEVVSVFKGRHKFNRHIRNGKRHVRIFPTRGDPTILPKKISFYGNIQRDVLFAEKVVLCYRCKTRHMLGENCPVATPTNEDSAISLNKQSDTLSQNQMSIQPDPSAEILPCAESLQQPSTPAEDVAGGDHSEESSDSDSDSVSDSGSCSDSGSHSGSGPGLVASLGGSLISPSTETSSENSKAQTSIGQTSPQVSDQHEPLKENHMLDNQKTGTTSQRRTIDKSQTTRLKNRPLRSLRNFNQIELINYRNDTDFFLDILDQAKITKHREYLAKMLTWAADLIYCRMDEGNLSKTLATYTRRYSLDQDLNPGPTYVVFDDYLYGLAEEVSPYFSQIFDPRH